MASEHHVDEAINPTPGTCPFGAPASTTRPAVVRPNDTLALLAPKRMVAQYSAGDDGQPRELHLFYGAQEVSFDEPELFAFGETLAVQAQFRAGEATTWGAGYEWTRLQPLFDELVAEGILEVVPPGATVAPDFGQMVCPSPLPASTCADPRTWSECESITGELTGHAVEVGHLELIIPVFRVAHIALDTDGRQVGEANVFPRALRLDRPTTWLTCAYPGTRYLSDRPMNVTALKSMRLHWRQMMAALLVIRAAFLRRCPDADGAWTVGRIERLATVVLAVPTYQLVRCDRPLANGDLHPALSSLFRVTDGLRMTMHQMLFVPIGEPTMSPDAPLTSDQVFDYAERNYSFHSETGVCAGPRHMVQKFLRVLIDGDGAEEFGDFTFDAPVASALADLDEAFDYGLMGLQAYAAFFSFWPLMTRTYAHLADLADAAVADGVESFAPFRDRFRSSVAGMKRGTYLATEEWRQHREQVYDDMYEQCGRALRVPTMLPRLAAQLAPGVVASDSEAARTLAAVFGRHCGSAPAAARHIAALSACVIEFCARAQAIFGAAERAQVRINAMLDRPAPGRRFGSADADVHNLLQGAEVRRLPYLIDELNDALGVRIDIGPDQFVISDERAGAHR